MIPSPHTQEEQILMSAARALEHGKITQAEHDYYVKEKLKELCATQPIERNDPVNEQPPAPTITRRNFSLQARGDQERRQDSTPLAPKITRRDFSVGGDSQNDSAKPHHPRAKLAFVLFIMLGFASILFSGGGITGFITFDVQETLDVDEVFTQSTSYLLNVSNTTTIKLSGSLQNGSVSVTANSGNRSYLVYNSSTDTLSGLWLNKKVYAHNETIEVTVLPSSAEYTLWLIDSNGSRTAVIEPVQVQEHGMYTLEALVNESGAITKFSSEFALGDNGSSELLIPTLEFIEACEETCTITSMSKITLNITLSEGASFDLQSITTTTPRTNTAPTQAVAIPSIAVNGSATIDLTGYFIDADNDSISYEINNIVGLQESIVGSELTIQGDIAGTYSGTVYASDGQAITLSNTFDIIVLGEEIVDTTPVENGSNTSQTQNASASNSSTTNNTILIPEVVTPPLEVVSDPCANANVNARPTYCFEGNMDAAFEQVVAPLYDGNQNRIARFTRFGNMVLKGMVIENSPGVPDQDDFSIGYSSTENFVTTTVATAWVDSETGDLHLRGSLVEENQVLIAPQYNSYIVQNNNGIILAYFDEITGNLYLKGNIVQLGRP